MHFVVVGVINFTTFIFRHFVVVAMNAVRHILRQKIVKISLASKTFICLDTLL